MLEQIQCQEQMPSKKVIPYDAQFPIFAVGFSNKVSLPCRIGLCSFLQDTSNYIEILQLNNQEQNLSQIVRLQHKYPINKILFSPNTNSSTSDIFATSSDSLKIWSLKNSTSAQLLFDLIQTNQFCAPLTSFDWNPHNINFIATSSIDATCSIWDIQYGTPYTQMIAHDTQIYDISFSSSQGIFASVGADGTLRQFDVRDLKHSSIAYFSKNKDPILKLAWSRNNPSTNIIAILQWNKPYTTLIDIRKSTEIYKKLKGHSDNVNAMSWAPASGYHICSVSDDNKAYIWNVNQDTEISSPLLQYPARQSISNLAWSSAYNQFIAVCMDQRVEILKI